VVKEKPIDLSLESDSDCALVPSPPRNKKKSTSPPLADDDEDDPPVEMSFYLYVETPAPRALAIRKGNAKPAPPQITPLGPYIFLSSLNFEGFLQIIANGCHAKTANIALAGLQWKFDRPGNAQKKPLGNPRCCGFGGTKLSTGRLER
jgi:hypothetical protein